MICVCVQGYVPQKHDHNHTHRSFTHTKDFALAPKPPGRLPAKALALKSTNVRSVNLPIPVGSDPEKALENKFSTLQITNQIKYEELSEGQLVSCAIAPELREGGE